MKTRIYALWLTATLICSAVAQVTTEPAFITQGYDGTITVFFNPNEGNKGMAKATQCYAHTGLITNESKTDSEWKYATPQWRGGDEKYKMTKEGDMWKLEIPSIYSYYNCPRNTAIKKLAFVFNDGPNGRYEGKTANGGDIFVDIHDGGLEVDFSSPVGNTLLDAGDVITFSASASQQAELTLTINGENKKSDTGTAITYEHTFAEYGDFVCIVAAKTEQDTVGDTVMICVGGEAEIAARPQDVKDGINYYDDESKATLVMYAKDKNGITANHVYLLGDFNDWAFSEEYQLKKDGETGYFWITLEGLTPKEEYAFQYAVKIDNDVIHISDAYSEKVLDPWNDSYLTEEYPALKRIPVEANGLVSILETGKEEFVWSEETLNFTKPDKNNLVIYELWVYDFSVGRTIREVTERLDYLGQLGVTAIELMPITEFDGNISWGYNPNHFFAADKAYGTAEDYKTFIDECHKHGIAVLLDMVFNHATGIHPFAKLYWNAATNKTAANNPWFNVNAPHPYSVFHDFNHSFEGTKTHLSRSLQYWIKEYRVDGFRMDLTKGLTNKPSTESSASTYDPERIQNIMYYYNAAKEADEDVIFIIEHFCDNREETELNSAGIIPWRNLNYNFGQTAMGRLSGDDLSGANTVNWVSYAESHDEERNFFKAKTNGNGDLKNDETARLSRVPLNIAFLTMQKGPKMIWQFGELGYDYSITHNGSSRTDPKPVPQALNWYKNDLRMSQYTKVAQMLQLRKKHSELFANGTCRTSVGGGKSGRYIQWEYNGEQIVIAGNFNASDNTEVAPFTAVGTWFEYFTGAELNITAATESITLKPGELKIFTQTKEELPEVDIDDLPAEIEDVFAQKENMIVYPTVSSDMVYIATTENVKSIEIYNISGMKVMSGRECEQIDISRLQSGLYLMVIHTDSTAQAVKIYRE